MTLSRLWHAIRKGLDMREISIKDRKKKGNQSKIFTSPKYD